MPSQGARDLRRSRLASGDRASDAASGRAVRWLRPLPCPVARWDGGGSSAPAVARRLAARPRVSSGVEPRPVRHHVAAPLAPGRSAWPIRPSGESDVSRATAEWQQLREPPPRIQIRERPSNPSKAAWHDSIRPPPVQTIPSRTSPSATSMRPSAARSGSRSRPGAFRPARTVGMEPDPVRAAGAARAPGSRAGAAPSRR